VVTEEVVEVAGAEAETSQVVEVAEWDLAIEIGAGTAVTAAGTAEVITAACTHGLIITTITVIIGHGCAIIRISTHTMLLFNNFHKLKIIFNFIKNKYGRPTNPRNPMGHKYRHSII